MSGKGRVAVELTGSVPELTVIVVVQHGFANHGVGVGLHMDVLGLRHRHYLGVHLRGEPGQSCVEPPLAVLDFAGFRRSRSVAEFGL